MFAIIADIYTIRIRVKLWVSLTNLQFPCRQIIVYWQKQCKILDFMDVAC
jgi:hypothetical protein